MMMVRQPAVRLISAQGLSRQRPYVPNWHLPNPALTFAARTKAPGRLFGTQIGQNKPVGVAKKRGKMQVPFLGGRKSFDDAAELIRLFGSGASCEAASRADQSRDRGNHIHFCRWRQVERLIFLMSIERPIGTIH